MSNTSLRSGERRFSMLLSLCAFSCSVTYYLISLCPSNVRSRVSTASAEVFKSHVINVKVNMCKNKQNQHNWNLNCKYNEIILTQFPFDQLNAWTEKESKNCSWFFIDFFFSCKRKSLQNRLHSGCFYIGLNLFKYFKVAWFSKDSKWIYGGAWNMFTQVTLPKNG